MTSLLGQLFTGLPFDGIAFHAAENGVVKPAEAICWGLSNLGIDDGRARYQRFDIAGCDHRPAEDARPPVASIELEPFVGPHLSAERADDPTPETVRVAAAEIAFDELRPQRYILRAAEIHDVVDGAAGGIDDGVVPGSAIGHRIHFHSKTVQRLLQGTTVLGELTHVASTFLVGFEPSARDVKVQPEQEADEHQNGHVPRCSTAP